MIEDAKELLEKRQSRRNIKLIILYEILCGESSSFSGYTKVKVVHESGYISVEYINVLNKPGFFPASINLHLFDDDIYYHMSTNPPLSRDMDIFPVFQTSDLEAFKTQILEVHNKILELFEAEKPLYKNFIEEITIPF